MADHEFSDEALEIVFNRLMDHADAHKNPEKAETLRYAAAVSLFDHTDADAVVLRRTIGKKPE